MHARWGLLKVLLLGLVLVANLAARAAALAPVSAPDGSLMVPFCGGGTITYITIDTDGGDAPAAERAPCPLFGAAAQGAPLPAAAELPAPTAAAPAPSFPARAARRAPQTHSRPLPRGPPAAS